MRFVADFQWFDGYSKRVTDEIPTVDLEAVDELINTYFPGGMIEW